MNTESYPMTNIVAPGDHDALCGRGGHTIHWSKKFRALVEQHRDRYHAASRVEKGKVVAEVVQMWRKMSPPGRFLTLSNPKLGEASPWHDIGNKSAQKKTAKRLREGHNNNNSSSNNNNNNCTATVVRDEDSASSESNHKRPRRVSNDSMHRAAKRVRHESAVVPSMRMMSFFWAAANLEDQISEVSGEHDFPEMFEEGEEPLDLDCLFDDIQPESATQIVTEMPPTKTAPATVASWPANTISSSLASFMTTTGTDPGPTLRPKMH